MNCSAGSDGAVQQALMEQRRVERGMAREHRAAEIGVAAELAALLAAGHHVSLDLEALRLVPQPLRQRFILRGIVRGVKAADAGEAAIDGFGAR